MKKYDLVVIGTGSGATTSAYTSKKAGLSVAIIDERPYGGTCALRGCDPKKVLIGVAEIIDRAHRMEGYGMEPGSRMNWQDLMMFKRTFTDPVPVNREQGFKDAGIDCFYETATFLSEDRLKVGNEILCFEKLLIASGSTPGPLSIKGEEYVIQSDAFLELDLLPKEMVFIGGGFISFEFAHLAARAGVKVHILHRNTRPLKHFEKDLVNLLVESSRELGIEIYLNTTPVSIKKEGERFVIHLDTESELKHIECDLVVHGAGRIPNLQGLDPKKGNVLTDKEGVKVDEYLRSISNPRVFAAGDVASNKGLPLTPIAGMDSKVVAHNLWHEEQETPDYSLMPSIVFTIPPLAMVGLTEEKARGKGLDIIVHESDAKEWYTYRRTREKVASVKTIIHRESGKLIGAHVLGENAGELINYFTLVMKFGLPLDQVKNMIFAYPTSASDLSYLL